MVDTDLLGPRMGAAIYPIELPIPVSHEGLEEFCGRIPCSFPAIAIPLSDCLLPHQNCYWNVLSRIEQSGGAIVYGWLLKHWPGVYLAAEHHAVWQATCGKLIDVTEPIPAFSGSTTFSKDVKQDFDLSYPPGIGRRYHPLTSDQRVADLIAISSRLDAITRSQNSLLHGELGHSSYSRVSTGKREDAKEIKMSPEQLDRYEQMRQEVLEQRLRIGDVIESLKLRPPNRAARIAARGFLNVKGE